MEEQVTVTEKQATITLKIPTIDNILSKLRTYGPILEANGRELGRIEKQSSVYGTSLFGTIHGYQRTLNRTQSELNFFQNHINMMQERLNALTRRYEEEREKAANAMKLQTPQKRGEC